MNRDDMNRWEAEIDSWRQRYEALLKTVADSKYLAPPMMLADKQSYELGFLHGAAAEREACAKECEEVDANPHVVLHHAVVCAAAIRARGRA